MVTGRLRYPGVFRDVSVALGSVGKSVVLDNRETYLIISAVDANLGFQVWATITTKFMFQAAASDPPNPQSEPIEIRTDNLVKALRNIGNAEEVGMRVKKRSGDSRILVVSTEARTYNGEAITKVQQRIPARRLYPEDLIQEPDFPGIKIWGEPNARQLQQMTRVCEQYRSMGVHISISLTGLGELTLTAHSPEAEATATWRVGLTEVVHADTPETPQTGPRQELSTCIVDTRDFLAVLQARQTLQRFILGVADGGGIAIHGYLQHGGQEDCLSFYLSPVTN